MSIAPNSLVNSHENRGCFETLAGCQMEETGHGINWSSHMKSREKTLILQDCGVMFGCRMPHVAALDGGSYIVLQGLSYRLQLQLGS